MKKTWKRLCTGFLALATVVTALPTTPVHAESKQYWTESKERVGIVEKVMNDGSIGSTFNEGHLTVEGEDAYCIDINTDFRNGYKTRIDASTRMSADQISDVALSIEYVKQYTDSHSGISNNHAYLLRQLVVWQRLSVHLGWQCDNVRASYDEIPKATQDEVFAGARAFVKENKGRYECGGYIYSGEGQELGQFWAKLNVGNAKLQKTSSNTSITDGNGNYSIAGATYGVFSDKDCTKQLATLTTDENGNTDVIEVTAGTVYIKELSAPAGYDGKLTTDDYVALLGRLDDFRKIGVPIQCDVDDARLLQGFHNRKAKIIKGDICEERGHRRLMRDEGETKLTPQEQSLNEEIEKLQDQWPYLMNEIFFIDYLKNPTYERGLAAKSKILVCFNDELLAAFLSAYKKANISEQQEMLTILKEISFRGGAVERDETDTEVTRKNLEKLENALNSEVEHTSDAVKKFYANRHLETVKQIRQKFLNTREM